MNTTISISITWILCQQGSYRKTDGNDSVEYTLFLLWSCRWFVIGKVVKLTKSSISGVVHTHTVFLIAIGKECVCLCICVFALSTRLAIFETDSNSTLVEIRLSLVPAHIHNSSHMHCVRDFESVIERQPYIFSFSSTHTARVACAFSSVFGHFMQTWNTRIMMAKLARVIVQRRKCTARRKWQKWAMSRECA